MSWERALEADARLAARNAVLIRAALRQSFDAERAFIGYQNTMPDDTLSLPQQRVRARAWAIMNIRPNLEPLRQILFKLWAEGYALGDLAAREAIAQAQQAQKADIAGAVDWSKWKPGDATAAILLKPPRAFQRLIEGAGITLKGFSDTTLTDIGNAIGEAIELGLSAKTSAKNIMRHVANPARALTIAITEQNRAISTATMNRYLEAGISQQRWLVFDPCKICAQNENVRVSIGAPFPSGDTQPPAHPNCRCALAPVLQSESQQNIVPGAVNVVPPTIPVATPTITQAEDDALNALIAAKIPLAGGFVSGQWKELTRAEIEKRIKEKLYEKYGRIGYTPEKIDQLLLTNKTFKHERSLIEKGALYVNGGLEVQFYSGGASVPKQRQKEIVDWVDKLQRTNPRDKVSIIIGPSKKGAYGWAYLGGDKIWLAPKTAKMGDPNLAEAGKFKMPVLGTNPQWKYTLSHEWGHHIDEATPMGAHTLGRTDAIVMLKLEYKDRPDVFISGYAKEKNTEFFAEMFAEWFLSEGKTSNPLVQAMAKEFGWKA